MRVPASILVIFVSGCSAFPPLEVGAGFMGAEVHVSTPGWSAPVPVVESKIITTPTLLVPETSPAAEEDVASTPTGKVPVVVASVKTETLAVPSK